LSRKLSVAYKPFILIVVMLYFVMLNFVMLNFIMLNFVMLNFVMLNFVMLNFVMLNFILLNVVAPYPDTLYNVIRHNRMGLAATTIIMILSITTLSITIKIATLQHLPSRVIMLMLIVINAEFRLC
jgi:hypothetical protein